MKLKDIYNRTDLIELPISSGWLISKNELYTSEIEEDLETLFSGTNLESGKSLSVDFDEESEMYYLILNEQLRKNGNWDYTNFSNSKSIVESSSLNKIIVALGQLLDNSNNCLVPLKIPTWWFVRKNLMYKDYSVYNNDFNVEFIFEAFSTFDIPYFIEITLIKKPINIFNIFIAESGQKIPKSKTKFFNPKSFNKQKNIKLSSMLEVKEFLSKFLFSPDSAEL